MQSIQLISRIDNNKWWKNLFIHYASKGESFEIRCWDEEIESIAFSVNITPIKNSKYCYNCIFDKKVEIEYIMQLLNSFILIDDNEVINGGEIPIVNIYIKLKNGTTKNIGFISGRYFDSTGKQYAVDYKEYQKFVDTIYALKSGDLRTPMYSMGLPKEYLVNTQIYTNISKKIIETVIFMLSR